VRRVCAASLTTRVRLFGCGHVIGPVVAESAADARALIEAALARLGQVFVRVDTAATSQVSCTAPPAAATCWRC